MLTSCARMRGISCCVTRGLTGISYSWRVLGSTQGGPVAADILREVHEDAIDLLQQRLSEAEGGEHEGGKDEEPEAEEER